MGDPDSEFLVAIHELIEAYLCLRRGKTDEECSKFDREHPYVQGEEEQGDLPDAPYRAEHAFATVIEQQIAEELGLDWEGHGARIDKLFEKG